jgi:plasmid stability protein
MIALVAKEAHVAQVLIRNLDDETVKVLKRRARKHGRSLASEVRTILREAVDSGTDWRLQVEQVRALFEGRAFSDSSGLVREDRER